MRIAFDKAAGLTLREIPFQADSFTSLIERVGGPWGWTRRPKYYFDRSRDRLKNGRLFLLEDRGNTVGYALTLPGDVAEIENFGLFLEHTGKGYGQTFLPLLFDELFKGTSHVHLYSRSTNHRKVISFYRKLGMVLIGAEACPDDLIVTQKPKAWTSSNVSFARCARLG